MRPASDWLIAFERPNCSLPVTTKGLCATTRGPLYHGSGHAPKFANVLDLIVEIAYAGQTNGQDEQSGRGRGSHSYPSAD